MRIMRIMQDGRDAPAWCHDWHDSLAGWQVAPPTTVARCIMHIMW